MTNFICLTTHTGFDECWECGGSATLGGSQDAVTAPHVGGRYCSYECLESYREHADRSRRARDRRCDICSEPEGRCVTEFLDVDGVTMTPWPHEYAPRVSR